LIPVKLKILKLLIRELSNIMEGKEVGNCALGNGAGGQTEAVEDGEREWESDEEEWEDVAGSRPGSSNGGDDVDSGADILKEINTEVSLHCLGC
jgi:hypothetical protein